MDHWEQFKINNKDIWHYDPKKIEQNYTLVAKLDADFKDLLELAKNDSAFKKVVLTENVNTDNTEVNSRVESFRKWGYTDQNTISLQIYDDQYPAIFSRYKNFTNLLNPSAFMIKQIPGQSLPWHYDTFTGFMRKHNLTDDRMICRYLIFLEDWEWGHFFVCGNSVIHQWERGDIIHIPYRMHHASCNVGMSPKLTLTITGITTDAALHNKPPCTYTLTG